MTRILLLLFILSLTLPLRAQDERATPRKGEGISAFLERHHRPGKEYYQAFLKLNERRLKGKQELQLGVKYVLPNLKKSDSRREQKNTSAQAARTHKEPLFGRKYDDVQLTGNRLKGACFYVVSGHGGPDPGAIGKVGKRQLHEDEYAYDVALRLARCLMQEGAEVHIIIQDKKDGIRDDRYLNNSKRETCMGKPIPLNQVARLKQRCEAINTLHRKDAKQYRYCRAIFLHVDSRSKREQTDVFFYNAPQSTQGKRLADTMRRTFEQKYNRHQPNRGFEGTVSERGLYVLRNTSPVALFVELGNIQNAFDQRRFVIASNRQALAKWMMEGFVADFRRK